MGICPNCNAKIVDSYRKSNCPKCGKPLRVETSNISATLDVGQFFAPNPDLDSTPASPAPDGTLDLAIGPALLAEQSDIIGGTLDLPSSTVEGQKDNTSTFVFDPTQTVALPSLADMMATVVPNSAGMGSDPGATLPTLNAIAPTPEGDSQSGKTLEFDVAQSIANKLAATPVETGSEIRLRKMWDGAAGSSANPMHSLKAEGKASGSVFAKVGKRRISNDPNNPDDTADYLLIKKIGAGAMGVVYAARQKAIDRVVALKAIKAEQAGNDDSRQKFFYEAQITGDLDHPNIVPIYELGINDDGTLFYSMKMVSGTPWQDVIAKRSRDENIDTLMKVSDAIAFAHSRDVIHRDLKPENIMLGEFGEVMVMDWGLAVNLRRKQPFGLGGTPAYMAPEMARHDVSKIGPASDTYLLGAMLYQIVTGRPPHPGRTVTQCLMAAAQNEVLPHDDPDSLLGIAQVAMAAEPSDRYRSVLEFQDAIREYRRHAESIALANRSEETLAAAIKGKDYSSFSRALFGFRDALDLWPNNRSATEGLKRCRLAYGQSAYDRADYDLCLQTLEKSNPDEAKLYIAAEKAKKAAEGREQRFRTLRRALAAVVLFAVVGLSGLSAYIGKQFFELKAQSDEIAKKSDELRQTNTDLSVAKEKAEAEKVNAEKQTRIAQANADEAFFNSVAAQIATWDAEESRVAEAAAKLKAIENEQLASKNEIIAIENENIAKRNEQAARRSASIAKLGNFQTSLNLALAQADQFDVNRSTELLDSVREISLGDNVARFDNWALRRIGLLNNLDIPKLAVNQSITSMDISPNGQWAVIGTSRGDIKVCQFSGNAFKEVPDKSIGNNAAIETVAISPDGKLVIYSIDSAGKSPTVYAWNVDKPAAEVITAFEQRSIQDFAFSPDGKWLLCGNNGGIAKIKASPWSPPATYAELTKLPAKGELLDIQFTGDQVFCLTRLTNGDLVGTKFLLEAMNAQAVEVIDFSTAIKQMAPTFATVLNSSRDNFRVLVGLNDGRLILTQPQVTAGARELANQANNDQVIVMEEVEQDSWKQVHRSAIKLIRVHPDGSLLTISDEPVVHVWRRSAISQNDWIHFETLSGLRSNVYSGGFLANDLSATSGSDIVYAIDLSGDLIVWDVVRQKQRRQLVRMEGQQAAKRYESPMIDVGAKSISPEAAAVGIDRNGVLDRWLAGNGRSLPFPETQSRWSYVGHTPGAELVDVSLDRKANIMVTSARLKNAAKQYLLDAGATEEFCLWDVATGRMVNRWYRSDNVDARVTIIDGGKRLVVAGPEEVTVIRLDNPGEVDPVLKKYMPTAFSALNPAQPNVVALVRANARVQILDLQNPASWDLPGYHNHERNANSTSALKAAWSPSGKYLYVLLKDGQVDRYSWVEGKLLKSPAFSIPDFATQSEDRPWLSVDLDVTANSDGADSLYLGLRDTRSRATAVTELLWKASEEVPSLIRREIVKGNQYLAMSGSDRGSPSTIDAGEFGQYSNKPIAIIARGSDQSVIAIDSSGVGYKFDQQRQLGTVFGIPGVAMADHSDNADCWVSLHKNGVIFVSELDGSGNVTRKLLRSNIKLAKSIDLDAAGENIIVAGNQSDGSFSCEVIGLKNGNVLHSMPGIILATWKPGTERQFAVVTQSGNMAVYDMAGRSVELEHPALASDQSWASLTWMREPNFADSSRPSWYVVAHANTATGSSIYFVPAEPRTVDENVKDALVTQTFPPLTLTARISALAASPVDNLIVTGDTAGAVSVWFATPSIDEQCRELFTLPGHLGSRIEAIRFTADGEMILTSDADGKLFGWMARDPMVDRTQTEELSNPKSIVLLNSK